MPVEIIRYEWDIETIDEHGHIEDHNHARRLKDLTKADEDGYTYQLVLVKTIWDSMDNLKDRDWAYEKNGKLPVTFSGGSKVPERYIKEYKSQWGY